MAMRVLIVGFAVASLFGLSGLLAAEPVVARTPEVTGCELAANLERSLQAAVSVEELRRLDFAGADFAQSATSPPKSGRATGWSLF